MMNRRDSRMGRLRRRGWPEDEALATASRAGTLVVPVSKEPAMRPVVPCSIALILALFGRLAAQVDHEHNGERSEEHTSELQSQSNLVCRLLLEKKKKNKNSQHHTKE